MGTITVNDIDTNSVSDGFHTFGELYEHRCALYIALCKSLRVASPLKIWRSRYHSDGGLIEGWFLLGIGLDKGQQITYHLPNAKWDDTHFALTLERGPDYDGHTPTEVLKRLTAL